MDNNKSDDHTEVAHHTAYQSDRSKNTFLIILAFVMTAVVVAFLSIKKCAPELIPDNPLTGNSNAMNTASLEKQAIEQAEAAKAAGAEQAAEAAQKLAEQQKSQSLELPKPATPSDAEEATPAPLDPNGAAAISQQFVNTIIKLDPVAAKNYVEGSNISYATLAGLCMMFEDGNYQLIEDRPIRQMFLKENTAGYLVQVQESSTKSKASFALSLKRASAQTPWKITELNLDSLLSHYSTQISGGDIHYSPLIKNPKGGDALAIYFELDSNSLTRRTQKQLGIVNRLLKSDTSKKLVISGHTDALGSDDYNLSLSRERAQQVRDFLVRDGLNKNQVTITGFGKNQPRQPNTKKDGADSPEGRRANRRAEILLDF